MTYKYPALTATRQAPAFPADEARALAANLRATLVEYYEHAGGWSAFIVTPQQVQHVSLPIVDEVLLQRMTDWLEWIRSPAGRNNLSYKPLGQLHEALIAPLRDYLPASKPVYLAPFSWLHLLPLGVAIDPASDRYVAEDYRLAFAPSLAALRVMIDQHHRPDIPARQLTKGRLLTVAYPGTPGSQEYLRNVLPEANAVARHFAQVKPLYEDEATPDAVLVHSRGKDAIHVGCHGSFDRENPERSGLVLSDGWLTVQRIISELRLDNAQLATLSSCFSASMSASRVRATAFFKSALILEKASSMGLKSGE
jgi:CHAT domain-containing protein